MQRGNLTRTLVGGAFLFSSSAWAAHPLVTEDAGTQGRGNYQLELQYEHGRDKEEGRTETTSTSVVVLSYGFHERADVMVGLPYERVKIEENGTERSDYGRGDLSVEIKWRFYEQEKISWALKSGLRFPTGDDEAGFGTGKTNANALLIGSFELEPMTLHVSGGYLGNRNDVGEKKDQYLLSFGGWYSVGDYRLVFDVGRFSSVDLDSDKASVFGIVGFIYAFSKDLDLDLGVKRGLSDPEVDTAFLAGVTWRF